jgi:F-type H+-transporting ATPase subunit b
MLDMLSQEPFFFKWQVAIVQMAGFTLFFLILKVLFFDRVLGFMRRRTGELAETQWRIEAARKDVERLAADYQGKLAAADKAAYEEMQKVVRAGLAAKTSILAAAQDEGRRIVDEARRAIADEKAEALRELDAQVRKLAEDIASAAVGGAVKVGAASRETL